MTANTIKNAVDIEIQKNKQLKKAQNKKKAKCCRLGLTKAVQARARNKTGDTRDAKGGNDLVGI